MLKVTKDRQKKNLFIKNMLPEAVILLFLAMFLFVFLHALQKFTFENSVFHRGGLILFFQPFGAHVPICNYNFGETALT